MAHKIDGVGAGIAPPARLATEPAGTRAPASGGAPVAAPVAADSARLTGEAAELAQLQQELAQNPAMDLAKVDAVRSAIESGAYRIDPQAIASRMIQLEQELGG
jgi:negative regulator of flagellin synthesis FlgM